MTGPVHGVPTATAVAVVGHQIFEPSTNASASARKVVTVEQQSESEVDDTGDALLLDIHRHQEHLAHVNEELSKQMESLR